MCPVKIFAPVRPWCWSIRDEAHHVSLCFRRMPFQDISIRVSLICAGAHDQSTNWDKPDRLVKLHNEVDGQDLICFSIELFTKSEPDRSIKLCGEFEEHDLVCFSIRLSAKSETDRSVKLRREINDRSAKPRTLSWKGSTIAQKMKNIRGQHCGRSPLLLFGKWSKRLQGDESQKSLKWVMKGLGWCAMLINWV